MDPVTDDRGVSGTAGIPAEDQDAFGDAFKEAEGVTVGGEAGLSAADNPDNLKADLEPSQPSKDAPAVATTTATATSTATVGTAGVDPAVVDVPGQLPGETDEKYEQRYKTLQGMHRHDKELWETRERELLAQIDAAKKIIAPTGEKPTKEEAAAAEAFVDSLTPEQKEQLAQYEVDFDTVSKMEGLKRTQELGKLRTEVKAWIDEIAEKITPQNLAPAIAPVIAERLANDATEVEVHFDAIRNGYDREDGVHIAGHTDFEQYRDDGSLLAWIEAKPAYLQATLKQVYEKGSAPDVIDLYTDFKREANIQEIIQPSPDNVVQLNPKKAERKAALASVTNRRGAVATGTAIAEDYDGAYDEALHKIGG